MVALLLLLGGGALTLARQRQQVPSSGSRPRPPAPEDHDSEHELHLLHNEPPPEFCEKPSVPVVCAHGGDASAAPPNTARAFQAAADAGVRCVEVDAALTRDGHLVVLHSRDLARLLGEDPNASPAPSEPEGPEEGRLLRKRQRRWLPQVGDYTLEQLQQLRYDSGEGVELVSSVVEAMLPYMDHVILDIKTYRQASARGRAYRSSNLRLRASAPPASPPAAFLSPLWFWGGEGGGGCLAPLRRGDLPGCIAAAVWPGVCAAASRWRAELARVADASFCPSAPCFLGGAGRAGCRHG